MMMVWVVWMVRDGLALEPRWSEMVALGHESGEAAACQLTFRRPHDRELCLVCM